MNDIRRILRTLEPVLGRDTAGLIEWRYEREKVKGGVLLPPPQEVLSTGAYRLGRTLWLESEEGDFGLREEELPQHIAIFGRTGSGKTNVAFLLLQELLKKDKPFLIFDWKQSYRPLTAAGCHLYTPGYFEAPFSFNPLDLKNIPEPVQDAYLRQLLSTLMNVYFRDLRLLSVEGAEYLLLRGMDSLKEEKGTFTFIDLYHWLANYKGTFREKDWKSSVMNVLYKLTTGPLGQVLNQEKDIDIEEIIQGKTLVELHWLGSPKDKSFVMQALLLQLYYQFSREVPSRELRFMIFIEEAHNVLLKHLKGYETVVEIVLRQIREYGVGICLLDQHPSLMSLPALGTYTTIAMSLRTREDLAAMEPALNLYGDKDYLNQLKVGQGIVKLQDRILKPFLVQFPPAEIRNEAILSLMPVIPPESEGNRLSEDGVKLLTHIHALPTAAVTERYMALDMKPKRGNKARQELEKAGLVHPYPIKTPQGRVMLFEITEIGKEKLRDRGIDTGSPKRKGSLLHQYWVQKTKESYERQGYWVREEFPVGKGKSVDLVAEKGTERIAIEIETGRSDALGNIRKCLESGFEDIRVVAIYPEMRTKILEVLDRAGVRGKKVRIMTPFELSSPR